jgi:tetratricopeptide (TPR) repeat protein
LIPVFAAVCAGQDAASQLNLGLKYLREGQPDKAVAPLLQAASDSSLAAEAHYLLGAAYFESGEYAKVAPRLSGLEQGPHAEHVLFLAEESSRLTGNSAAARQAFRQLNQRFPDSPWLHFLMGAAYESQSDHERAIAEYRNGLAKDPKLPNANFAVGYIYWQDRDFAAAKPWLEQELQLHPCHSLAAYYLGDVARAQGQKDRAVELYKRSAGCNSQNEKAHLGLGTVLAELNRDQEALTELLTAARLDDSDATAHYRLAVLYRKLARKSDADAEFAKVNQIHAAGREQAVENLKGKP